jgi:hypothetical protein
MPKKETIQQSENIIQNYSQYFTKPPTFELLRLKELRGEELTEDEMYEFNESLGVQARRMRIEIEERLGEINPKLKQLREEKNSLQILNLGDNIPMKLLNSQMNNFSYMIKKIQ